MINWKVRIKNKNFWIAMIPALFVLIKAVLAIFGISVDFATLTGKILSALDAVFVILTIIGVVNDPTTEGLSDSYRAMTYEEPYKKKS